MRLMDVQRQPDAMLHMAAQHGVRNVRIFLVAWGGADAASDVDLLVEFKPGWRLLDLAGVLVDREDVLGCQVDVVMERGLRERMRGRVLQAAVPL
jgi:predicted nucleotidyltransferase